MIRQPTPIAITLADEPWRARIADEWGELEARHMHFADGFTLLALADGAPVGGPVGLVAVQWRPLPPPLESAHEGFVDIIAVRDSYRRQGITRALLDDAAGRAHEHGACQLRAWSSEDKGAALAMWRALGWGLCPAVEHPRGQEVRGFYVARAV